MNNEHYSSEIFPVSMVAVNGKSKFMLVPKQQWDTDLS